MAPLGKENSGGQKKGRQGRRKSDDYNSSSGDVNGEDYRRRREKNNQAVKRSRVRSKLRTQQTLARVNQLKTENEKLEEKIKLLTKELGFLKDLFLAHAGSAHGVNLQNVDLEAMLKDEPMDEARLELLEEGKRMCFPGDHSD